MGLFNSTVLDVAIGLVFVYLLLAILCTAANEWASALTRRRGKMLEKGIGQLLDGQLIEVADGPKELVLQFYRHPLIRSMMHDKNHPAYVSARTFSTVLVDLINPASENLMDAVGNMPTGDVKRSLRALIEQARRKPEYRNSENEGWFLLAIEGWFNDAMDRVSGWYKRRTQVWTIVIAVALTVLANADTVQITRRLWTDPVLRSEVVEEAKNRAEKPEPTISVEYEDEDDPTKSTVTRTEAPQVSAQETKVLGQLLGWRNSLQDNSWKEWLERLAGWFLTVLALSMGAPFWFDMLNKFTNVRYSGKSPDEPSKAPEKTAATARP